MILVEQVEARTVADRQVAAVMLAAGAKKVEMPDPDEARATFDRMLTARARPVTPDRQILLEALGVSRGRRHPRGGSGRTGEAGEAAS